jgi:hypothetical protein
MFNFLKKEKEPENIKDILKQFRAVKEGFKKVSKELRELKKDSNFFIQKMAIIRYNPFKESGGNQSFSIAMLDKKDSGIVITSLYNRDGNRVFAKPINKGRSEYLLSEEEKKAIEKAKKSNIQNGDKKQ